VVYACADGGGFGRLGERKWLCMLRVQSSSVRSRCLIINYTMISELLIQRHEPIIECLAITLILTQLMGLSTYYSRYWTLPHGWSYTCDLPITHTDMLATLHWLCISEQIEYKISLLTFRVMRGSALPHFGPLMPVRSLPSRWWLRSTGTNRLLVPPVKQSTVGSRAFPVAGPKTWNSCQKM